MARISDPTEMRDRPFVSHEVIVNLIANVTTRTGLRIRAKLDRGTYLTGV